MIACYIAELLCYCKNDTLYSLGSKEADFLLVEIYNTKATRPAVSSGEERGLPSRTARLVIEPNNNLASASSSSSSFLFSNAGLQNGSHKADEDLQ